MVKNTTGGYNKNKKRTFKQEVHTTINEDQLFGKILKNNGSHWSVCCSDNIERIGRLSAKMKKGQRLTVGSSVIVSLRDESDKLHCDIIALADIPKQISDMFGKSGDKKKEEDVVIFAETEDEFDNFEQNINSGTINVNNLDETELWDMI